MARPRPRRSLRARLALILAIALGATAFTGVVAAPAQADTAAKISGWLTRAPGSTSMNASEYVYLYSVSVDTSFTPVLSTLRQYKSVRVGYLAAQDQYIFTDVAPGTYLVEFGQPNTPNVTGNSAFQWFNGGSGANFPSGATPITVKTGSTSDNSAEADMTIQPGNTIAGVISHGPDPAADYIPNLPEVDLTDVQGGRADGIGGYLKSTADGRGNYRFTNLAAGSYVLNVLPYDNGVDCNTSYVVGVSNPGGIGNPVYNWDLAQEGRFASTPTPTISGALVVGSTLTANPGPWDSRVEQLSYQWYGNDKPISGQTTTTLTLTSAMLAQTVSVAVTATTEGFCTVTKSSLPTLNVQGLISSISAPAISGVPVVRGALTASGGSWNPSGTSLTYQWLADGQPIAGAISSTFTPAAADYKKQIAVRVTSSKNGYVTASAASAAKTIEAGAFTKLPVPKISGSAVVGKALTAKPGTWAPGKPKFTYRWYANGAALKTGTKYKLTISKSLAGKQLSVHVTAKLTGFVSATRQSASTKPVVKAPVKKKPAKKKKK